MNNWFIIELPKLIGWHKNLLIWKEIKFDFFINKKLVQGQYNCKIGYYVFSYLPGMNNE